MSALQKMLGIDGVDFAAIGKDVQAGIDGYNRKLDAIIETQERILETQKRLLALLAPHLLSGESQI